VATPIAFLRKIAALSVLGSAALITHPLQAAPACNPLSLATCALPFPSDFWTQDDDDSPTGARINISNDVIRAEVLAQLPIENGISVEQIFNDASGFSAASAVVFEFDQQPDASTLPKHGGDAVHAFDLTTGETLDIRTQINAYARGHRVSAPSNVLEVFPMGRWPFGHRIAVVVTRDLHIEGEEQDFLNRQETAASPAASNYLVELALAIEQIGLPLDQIRNATLFTVRDRDEVLTPIRTLVQRTFESEHPIRNLEVHYKSYFSRKAALITSKSDSFSAPSPWA